MKNGLALFVLWIYGVKNILPDKVSIWKRNKSNFILIHLLFVGIAGKSYYEIHVVTHTYGFILREVND